MAAGRCRPRRAMRWARLLVPVLLIASCVRNVPQEDVDTGLSDDPVSLHVTNENFLDANVFVVVSGVARRLGQVNGNGAADFEIKWSVLNGQSLVLSARMIGGSGGYTSPSVNVGPGQSVVFRIGSVLRQSTVVVREP